MLDFSLQISENSIKIKEELIMEVPIRIFEHLHYIAQRHGKTQVQWAKLSGVPQSTIAYFVRTSRMERGLVPPFKTKWKCTIGKMNQLYKGLERMIGMGVLQKEILERASIETDSKNRLLLYTIAMVNSGNDKYIGKMEAEAKLLLERLVTGD